MTLLLQLANGISSDNDERLRIVQLKQVTNVTTTNYKLID